MMSDPGPGNQNSEETLISAAPGQPSEPSAGRARYADGRRLSRFAIASIILPCLATGAMILRDQAGGPIGLRDPALNRILLTFLEVCANLHLIGGLMGGLAVFQIIYRFRELRGIALGLAGIGAAVGVASPISASTPWVFPIVLALAGMIIEAVLGLVRTPQAASAQ
jgi:hypothetical protein